MLECFETLVSPLFISFINVLALSFLCWCGSIKMSVDLHTYVFLCLCMCAGLCVCVCVCVCVCLSVFVCRYLGVCMHV